jgi:hypothetical protein
LEFNKQLLDKTTKKGKRDRKKMGLLYSSISDSHAFFFTKEGKTFLDEKRI